MPHCAALKVAKRFLKEWHAFTARVAAKWMDVLMRVVAIKEAVAAYHTAHFDDDDAEEEESKEEAMSMAARPGRDVLSERRMAS